ncbi:MAG: hypothetical protein U0869_01785 [Chloroflexota bacterium]
MLRHPGWFRRTTVLPLVSLVLAVALGPVAAAAGPGEDPPTPLEQALAHVPADASVIAFTDWNRLKAARGLGDLTGDTPADQRLLALDGLERSEALFSSTASMDLRGFRERWGWDPADLDWEAEIGPVGWWRVLRFPDGFDLGAVRDRYLAAGWSMTMVGDATALWDGRDKAVFLADGRTLLLGDVPRSALEAVDGTPPPGIRPTPLGAVVGELETPLTAIVLTGDAACTGAGAGSGRWDARTDPRNPPANVTLLDQVGPLHPWTALAAATEEGPGDTTTARFAFAFADEVSAAVDSAGRTILADQGTSLTTGLPYIQSVFRVTDTAVHGTAFTIDTAFVNSAPSVLHHLVDEGEDLLFATCR